jgi:hypothetical protein
MAARNKAGIVHTIFVGDEDAAIEMKGLLERMKNLGFEIGEQSFNDNHPLTYECLFNKTFPRKKESNIWLVNKSNVYFQMCTCNHFFRSRHCMG